MLLLFIVQNFWWVFLLTTVALVMKCILTQKQLTALKEDVAFRKDLAQKRFRVAQDLNDELSNGFNNIKIIAKESNPSMVEYSKRDFIEIQKLCNDLINHMEDVLWALKNRDCVVEDLIFRVEDYIDDVFREKGIDVKIVKKGLPLDRKIGFYRRRNFLLYFKEVVNFFIENTLPDQVNIFIEYQPNHFELWMKNQYQQKINSPLSLGTRLTKMSQLAEAMGGKNIIKDEPNIYEIGLVMKWD